MNALLTFSFCSTIIAFTIGVPSELPATAPVAPACLHRIPESTNTTMGGFFGKPESSTGITTSTAPNAPAPSSPAPEFNGLNSTAAVRTQFNTACSEEGSAQSATAPGITPAISTQSKMNDLYNA